MHYDLLCTVWLEANVFTDKKVSLFLRYFNGVPTSGAFPLEMATDHNSAAGRW